MTDQVPGKDDVQIGKNAVQVTPLQQPLADILIELGRHGLLSFIEFVTIIIILLIVDIVSTTNTIGITISITISRRIVMSRLSSCSHFSLVHSSRKSFPERRHFI
jgi:hypothetical protein